MAKLSAVNKNKKRIKLSDRLYKKRQALKKIVMDKKIPLEERFKAQHLFITLVLAEFLGSLDNFCCALNLSSNGIFLSITIFFNACLFL